MVNRSFSPQPEYIIVPMDISIKDFFDYREDYVTRPPYQRKVVWSKQKKQALMDSLFRRYYIPRLVVREVRFSEGQTSLEVIDGQQRITTVQDFFDNRYRLPQSLEDLDAKLPGLFYKDLDSHVRKFVDKSLKYQVDKIMNIEKPHNVKHQITATEIFWRLQQGESLNSMEIAHAQLSSLTRNFIVKYADDQTFNYEDYQPVDQNPHKVPFFSLLDVSNSRMKHLQFMARFIMMEKSMMKKDGGYTDLHDRNVDDLINDYKREDGIGDYSFEKTPEAMATLKTLKFFYEIFKDDPMPDSQSGIKELSVEYFILSVYLLVRHLHTYYVLDESTKTIIREFVYDFHARWKQHDDSTDTDFDLLTFSDSRQHGPKELETRDIILRHLFFKYLLDKNKETISKDSERPFSELERIKLYRDGKGMCRECLTQGKPENEAKISWSNYQADHIIPYAKGGKTVLENAALLCRYHNQSKNDLIN